MTDDNDFSSNSRDSIGFVVGFSNNLVDSSFMSQDKKRSAMERLSFCRLRLCARFGNSCFYCGRVIFGKEGPFEHHEAIE